MIRMTAFALLFPFAGLAAPTIITDIPPISSLAAAVTDGIAAPESLITSGGDSHHHQLRPSEARKVAAADLLIWVGPAMSPWLAGAAEGLGKGQQLALIDQPNTHIRQLGPEGVDPHLWLDPENARVWLAIIAETLAEIDPDNAATYRQNATEARAVIKATTAEAQGILAKATDRPIITSHDAYGYFTDAMNLPPALSLRDASDNAPSARALRALRENIATSNAACLHPEPDDTPQSLAALDGLGLRQGNALDVLGLDYAAPGPDLYPEMLLGLARSIAECHTEAAENTED